VHRGATTRRRCHDGREDSATAGASLPTRTGEDFEGDPLSSGVTTQRRARPVLDLIGRLYAVEAEVPTVGLDATADDSAAARALRARLRANQSRGIVGEIRAWALGQRVLPESSLGKAIRYMLGLWPGLTRFLADPRIPIDNNHTERSLRGVVLGRRIHYGSRSQRGTQAAALFYSLIESAKLVGVGPKAYLLQAVRERHAPPTRCAVNGAPAPLTPSLPGGFRVAGQFAIIRAESAAIARDSERL
jgi:Transposase IS66 family